MFVIFKNDVEYFEYMVDCNGKVCHKDVQNHLLYKLCNIHRSVKLNKICNMPLKNVWYNYYLDYDLIDKNDKNIFVFFEGNQMAYDRNFIIFLKKRFINSKFVFRYTNIICYLNSWTVDYINKTFDLVVTIDWKESKKRNWMYFPNTYNLGLVDNKRNVKIKYDLFFVGRDKGRFKQLVTLYNILSKKGIRCLFLINGVEEKDRIYHLEGIKNIKIVSYQDIVKYIAESRCILEILQDNQYGAVCVLWRQLLMEKNY